MSSLRVFVKSAIFTVLVPGTVAVGLPQLLAKYRPEPKLPLSRGTGRFLGCISFIAGVFLYFHTVCQFGTEGHGTPSPTDEPDDLVTGGAFAHSRNPMYIAVLLVILAQALWQRSTVILWWACGMWIGFHNRVIGYEEPHLAEKHGEAYDKYCADVPRWFG